MERDHPDGDGVPRDDWLMATMEWEGGIPATVAEFPDTDEPEERSDGE